MPELKVRIEKGSATAGDGQEIQENTGSAKQASTNKMAVVGTLVNFAISQGKSILSASISQIGVTTGDYIKQERIQEAMGYAQDAVGIGTAFAVNWVVGALAVATTGIKYAIQITSEVKQNELENNKISYIRNRSGNTLINGSRTGD